MDSGAEFSLIAGLFSLTFMLNLLFGYFRGKTKKYSFRWFLCIHLPILFILIARVFSHLDFSYIPIFVVAAIIGQFWGGRMEF